MSPVSRGRKKSGRKVSSRRTGPNPLRLVPDLEDDNECGCAFCQAGLSDLDGNDAPSLISALGGALLAAHDGAEAELMGAALVGLDGIPGELIGPILGEMVPMLETMANRESLALLSLLGAVGPTQVGAAAETAARRLEQAGIAPPAWKKELALPVIGRGFQRLADPQGLGAALIGRFSRGTRDYACVVSVDYTDCGAAVDARIVDGADLPDAIVMLHAAARRTDNHLASEELEPAEFRWQVENALAARDVHDAGDEQMGLPGGGFMAGDEADDEPADAHRANAFVTRRWIEALPAPNKPPAQHGQGFPGASPAAAEEDELTRIARALTGGRAAPRLDQIETMLNNALFGRAFQEPLPPKPMRGSAKAPIYQVKVGIRGAKPPIWRRLEVPADVRLDELHEVIQAAFAWHGYHMHVFETPYGEFGEPDIELGHEAENAVSLEQVLPEAKNKIRYTYDFGDDWEHDVVLEKILPRQANVDYPRCTGGRRAAPPEDCGGIWGYMELVEAVADPAHPSHNDALEQFRLDRPEEFDPAEFNADAITARLPDLD